MKRFVAFLRGVNISGKNKIAMGELKTIFEKLDFAAVKTYLNSGNVAFSSNRDDKVMIAGQLAQMIESTFGFSVPVFVISQEELKAVLRHAPDWWGTENEEVYDNLIFILCPTALSEVLQVLGAPKEDLEQVHAYKQTIFWSFNRKAYQKTNWWSKTAGANIAGELTIRTAGTVRKICEM